MRLAGFLMAFLAVPVLALAAPGDGDWSTYGHDKGSQRDSPLTQITPDNVSRLTPAWVYHMKPAATSDAAVAATAAKQPADENVPAARTKPRFLQSQMTPLVADGRMYIASPYGPVTALDPTTGKVLWSTPVGGPANNAPDYRGVEYWPGDEQNGPRVVFGTNDGRLAELDAATGAFVQSFGDHGSINLKTDDIMNGYPRSQYLLTSPPLVTGNLIIQGARVQENPMKGASGDIRAWNVRTGKLVWRFHTIPRSGEPNYGTWASGSDVDRSGANVWGFMSVDEKRSILYLPVADGTYDRYGGDRPGDNLYGSSLVALDVKTGKYLWHFQLTHHDIWDFDTQGAPVLFEAKIGGRSIPAVAITSKAGFMFLFNRVTGKPLYPVKEVAVPPSDTPGEIASPTQPVPATDPLSRNTFKYPDDITDVTPELHAFCDNLFTSKNMKGMATYEPFPFKQPGVHFPGTEGGNDWDGQAFNPGTGYLILPANNMGVAYQMVPGRDGIAYRSQGGIFREPQTRDNCQKGPWAVLDAFDTATGKLAWQVPLGITEDLPLAVQNTGRSGHGGAITTDSGLVFIGFSDDKRFRAFDVRTG
ncbi:MAG TPA: PQQ-binding-like beta-propeller repeat protein, partial [Devosia sp.]|nr:PQQ-binding-like beta-propeller repeat protein [Devosia sp.]